MNRIWASSDGTDYDSARHPRRIAQGLFDELAALGLVWARGCEPSGCCCQEAEPEERPEYGQDQGAGRADPEVSRLTPMLLTILMDVLDCNERGILLVRFFGRLQFLL